MHNYIKTQSTLDSVSVSGIVSSIISPIIVSLTGQLKMFEDIVSVSACEGCTPQDAAGRKLPSGRLGSSPWEEEKEGQALEGSEMNDLQLSGGKLF